VGRRHEGGDYEADVGALRRDTGPLMGTWPPRASGPTGWASDPA